MKKLSNCVPGFAHGTTGGKGGEFYVVTDPIDNATDPKPRTLLHADLIVTSDKTINARVANMEICNGAGITVQFVKNVIIHHNIPTKGGKIKDGENHHGLRGASDGDGVSLFRDTNISFDHLSHHHCADGLIDAIQGSTVATVSNCHFTDHNDVMLFRASDSYSADKKMQDIVGLNHFGKGLVERMLRCRFGFIHFINNDYNHWFLYAIGGTSHPTNISQGNRYLCETPSGLRR
ncbi:hypothetical protein Godav_009948 [Gossypium davidsonii]|uniref:Pectate lyase domain-containing protein n=1 Tax=Gossypium davidsonii TaxID=34287 RepID=A0A7J8SEV7_GOSDV|nr:hypothetical protein [Gossypium davidsonii]